MASHDPRRLLVLCLPLAVGAGLAVGLALSASSDAGGNGRDDPDDLVNHLYVQLAVDLSGG